MLQIYIDDSGKEKDSPTQVLAGYMAKANNWDAFSKEWRAILGRVGLEYFRMADAWRMGRGYKAIGVLGRNQLISDLLACIRQHAEHAFVLSIDMEAFRYWFGRNDIPDERNTRPYFLGFHAMLSMICDHVYQLRDNEDFMIFFDVQGGESAAHTLAAVNTLRRAAVAQGRAQMRMPTPEFIPDTKAVPLQAADLLAWLVRREDYNYRNYRKKVDNNKEVEDWRDRSERIWLDQALGIPNTVKLLGEREIKELVTDITQRLKDVLNRSSR